MTPEQLDKAIQLCGDLQAHTLNELVLAVKKGERLGVNELRLVQNIRKQLETQRSFANQEARFANQDGSFANRDEVWLSLENAAKRLGVSVRTLQLWCSAKDVTHQPALPHRTEGRRVLLPLRAAHAHLTQNAKRLTLKKLAPAGPGDAPDDSDAEPLPDDLVERLETILTGFERSFVRSAVGLRLYSQTLKLLEDIKARRAEIERRLSPEDAIKIIRSLGACYCETIDAQAGLQACETVKQFNAQTGVNLLDHFAGAEPVLEAILRRLANDIVIPAMQRRVQDAVDEVKMQEGAG